MSEAFDRSINTAALYPLLTLQLHHFSIGEMRANCVLNPFLYPHKWGEKKCSIWVDNCFWVMRSNKKQQAICLQVYGVRLALGLPFYRQLLYQLILNFEGGGEVCYPKISEFHFFWGTLLQISENISSTFVGVLQKVPTFFEFKLEGSFVILDKLISVKWNNDSVDTFSLIIFTFEWS